MTPAILSMQVAVLCHIGFVFFSRDGSHGWREKTVCYAAILMQALGLQALIGADDGHGTRIHFGIAIGYFSMLALAVLTMVDKSANFRRSWRALSICAAIGCMLASLPIKGHALTSGSGLIVHFVLATLAYGFYLVSMSQLAELFYLNRSIASQAPNQISLPLLDMEKQVFRNIQIGFAILSCTIVSGIIVSLLKGGEWDVLSHKTLFAYLTWLASLVLLLCRWRLGWRGRTALNWMVTAVICLFLSYLGTSIVLDLILDRN